MATANPKRDEEPEPRVQKIPTSARPARVRADRLVKPPDYLQPASQFRDDQHAVNESYRGVI